VRTHLGHQQLPEAVLIQFVSPDDEHDVLETCIINRNKYIEKNLCITLFVYQESLHDARSTKCKMYKSCIKLHICVRTFSVMLLSA
jgi:hypothetical protein